MQKHWKAILCGVLGAALLFSVIYIAERSVNSKRSLSLGDYSEYWYVEFGGGMFPVPANYEVMKYKPKDYMLRVSGPVTTKGEFLSLLRSGVVPQISQLEFGSVAACRNSVRENWKLIESKDYSGTRVVNYIYARDNKLPLNIRTIYIATSGNDCVTSIGMPKLQFISLVKLYNKRRGLH
jgi:hypothetical protein